MLHPEYQRILQQFHDQQIAYVLLRYPHLIPREIPDIDVLCETTEGYEQAKTLLLREGYVPISREKLRIFLGKKVGETLILIDLYQEVSWWGWVVLDKKRVFQKKRQVQQLIVVPSVEDELLIYVGQGIFKNRHLDEHKVQVVRTLLQDPLDNAYLNQQLTSYGWKWTFDQAVKEVQKGTGPVSFSMSTVGMAFFRALIHAPVSRSKIFLRSLRYAFRRSKRRATVICLLGPDGSGKSTLGLVLGEHYQKFFKKFSVRTTYRYFGWDPFLPTTKIISHFFKKKNYQIVNELNKESKPTSAFQEVVFGYYYLEYLSKYLWYILPRLWKKEIILVDRYFYDAAIHYRSAEKSQILPILFRWYPRPDFTFVLDSPPEKLQQRKKEMSLELLSEHRKRYIALTHRIPSTIISTTPSPADSKEAIIDGTWQTIIKRVG